MNAFSLSRKTKETKYISEIINEISNFQKNIKVMLDIGCGDGLLTDSITSVVNVEKVYITDIYIPENISVKNDYIFLLIDQLDKIPDQSVDLISCMMSIHHFGLLTSKMFEIIRRKIKTTGYILIKEHCKKDLEFTYFLDCVHQIYEKCNNEKSQVTNYYTFDELDTIFKNYNFKLINRKIESGYNIQNKYRAIYKSEEFSGINKVIEIKLRILESPFKFIESEDYFIFLYNLYLKCNKISKKKLSLKEFKNIIIE